MTVYLVLFFCVYKRMGFHTVYINNAKEVTAMRRALRNAYAAARAGTALRVNALRRGASSRANARRGGGGGGGSNGG